jgi:charged multivesicular body protein 3
MNEQLAALRLAGSLQTSTDVMRAMQSLIKVPEVARTMQEMSKEMMKAGIIQEMMDDAMESAMGDDEETETEAQEEVDKILWELTAGQLGAAPSAVTDTLPAQEEPAAAVEDEEEELDEMRHRLAALRST